MKGAALFLAACVLGVQAKVVNVKIEKIPLVSHSRLMRSSPRGQDTNPAFLASRAGLMLTHLQETDINTQVTHLSQKYLGRRDVESAGRQDLPAV